MSTELQQPFGLSPSGGIAVVTDPGSQAQQHLQALVSTTPGERVMQPEYGVPLVNHLFGVDAPAINALVATDVQTAIRKWEPSVALQNVQIMTSDTSLGVVGINVEYTPGAGVGAATQAQTATVLVGGSVVS